jgi:hypothetical protein
MEVPKKVSGPHGRRALFPAKHIGILSLFILGSIASCHARTGIPSTTRRPLLPLRAGASDSFAFGRTRTPSKQKSYPAPSNQSPFQDTTSTGELKFDEQASTKEMLNAFLTRESRNTFIGTAATRIVTILLLGGRSVILLTLGVLTDPDCDC